jgi:hypothetical protein
MDDEPLRFTVEFEFTAWERERFAGYQYRKSV